MGAIHSIGVPYDVAAKVGSSLATTTSQYAVVGILAETTTADFTVAMTGGTAGTTTGYCAIGICQTYLSASAQDCQVRLLGVSKAICASSISAGQFVKAYAGASTTSRVGNIEAIAATGASITGANHSVTAYQVVLGRALEKGSTGTVISIMVNPQLYPMYWA